MSNNNIENVSEVVDTTDRIINFAEEFMSSFKEVVMEAAPIAWDALLYITIIDGVQNALIGMLSLIAVVIVGCYLNKLSKERKELKQDKACTENNTTLSIFSFIAMLMLLITVSIYLFDVWVWVKIFNPELAIAKDLFESAKAGLSGCN